MKAAMKRATVYFDPKIHRALRIKAAATDRSLSDIVNEAVRVALTEDAEDLKAFDSRANEPNLVFEEVLQDLKNRGQI
ncbi:MAG: CopG family transcriptional regulator [Acidobacteria bacterium]|nr:MAG: CopG family transcriptional regulator [Acidobacteriota bacterium]